MISGTAFLAAYLLLLCRLWQELESLLKGLTCTAAAPSQQFELRCELFRLELILLGEALERPRLTLSRGERARVRAIIDRLLQGVDVRQTIPSAVIAIEAAQDLLFEEVQRLLMPAESRIICEIPGPLDRNAA
jgi:hypothetical protein